MFAEVLAHPHPHTGDTPASGRSGELDPSERGDEWREAAATLALLEATRDAVPRLAALLRAAGSALALVEGRAPVGTRDRPVARALVARIAPGVVDHWVGVVAGTVARSPGTRLLPLTDPAYPSNLRRTSAPPVLIFVRGQLELADDRAIAVVGSRQAAHEHLESAAVIARRLSSEGMTVVSGLAAGVDAAAHRGALDEGGRTLAAIATGVHRVYPPEHRELADAVVAAGALVSRSWPDAPPTRHSFRLRNSVTSGLALATVVVDAGPRSGARMQARLALEQRRPVVLLGHLLRREEWARRLATRRGVHVAEGPDEALDIARGLLAAVEPDQLRLF